MALDVITLALLKKKVGLVDGKIPAEYLPSYVDEVLSVQIIEGKPDFSSEWLSLDGIDPLTPSKSKIYHIISNGKYLNWIFRWTGISYIAIGGNTPEEIFSTKAETEELLKEKQDILVDGENIKTLNGQSILGKGNLEVKASTIQASSTEIGGIIAEPKTVQETQEVKIDPNTGKLYVAPTSGSLFFDEF